MKASVGTVVAIVFYDYTGYVLLNNRFDIYMSDILIH